MPFRRNFDLNEDFRRGIAEVVREMKVLGFQMVKDAADYLDKHNVNMDGDLKKSLISEVDTFLGGAAAKLMVGAGAAHAEWVHDGTRPRKKPPPIEPIRYWVRKKLNIADEAEVKSAAYAIAMSIKKRGTSMKGQPKGAKGPKGRPFLDFALEKHRDKFTRRMQDAFNRGFNKR